MSLSATFKLLLCGSLRRCSDRSKQSRWIRRPSCPLSNGDDFGVSESDTDIASLSLPSSSSCSAGVYVDVGMDRNNKYEYDVLHARSQTETPQGPHDVG